MKRLIILFLITILLLPISSIMASEEVELPDVKIDMSKEAISRGEDVFKKACNSCHGMKYMGYKAKMPGKVAARAFGKEPPDLSLMAIAKGKGDEGAKYIYALLTSYNSTPERNSIFPNIAMPQPIPSSDPELEQKSKDVAAFMLYAAEPTAEERIHLGRYVMVYMVILTALLYALNRKVWKPIKKH